MLSSKVLLCVKPEIVHYNNSITADLRIVLIMRERIRAETEDRKGKWENRERLNKRQYWERESDNVINKVSTTMMTKIMNLLSSFEENETLMYPIANIPKDHEKTLF